MGNVYNMVGGGGGGIKLAAIAITTPPAKTTYIAGETFDPAGMVVKATYSNGATAIATGYTFTPSTGLTDGTTAVTIQYTEAGVTKTAAQAVTVVHRLESIAVTTQPTKTTYEYGDTFSSSGMVVTATYSDGATAAVTGYTTSPSMLSTVGTQTITVTYTEGSVTKTTTLDVTVERKTLTTVPSQSGRLTYTGSAQSPSWSNYDSAKLTIGGTTVATNAGSYNATFTPTANYRWSDGTTTAKTVSWSIGKAAGSLSLSADTLALDATTTSGTITVTRAGDGAISASSSETGVATVSISGNTLTITGVASGSATITVNVAEGSNHTAPSSKTVAVTVSFVKIYGVSWDGTSTTAWSRTDDAAAFTDPVPYVSGASSYGSPFDNSMPWSGMEKVEDSEAGTMVKIPKFWYKLEKSGSGLKIQIADKAVDGFSVSPAHMDRGDGKGERDVVYIGRYHCGASAYKSVSGQKPKDSVTRSNFRTNIHNLGSTIWQCDFAMRFTVWLLYLVEFANWNTQAKIGYGCGNGSATSSMGYTDSMPYHTGTTQSSRTTYGLGTQYRYIEGLWDNVYDWVDGCYNDSSGLNIILNPSSFSDSANGTSVGKPSDGYPSAFAVSTAAGFPMFRPSAENGSQTTYSCDGWGFHSSAPCVCTGGYYYQRQLHGLFCLNREGSSSSNAYIGSRSMKLP